MARPLRIEYPGALYHVTARGNARQDIFQDDDDRAAFLGIMCKATKRFNWLVHAYCLMGNHYHVLIETPDGNLSAGMRHLNGVYTQWFNRRHIKVGHLLQGRFKAIVIDKDTYLAELCRYIVLNPVRAAMITNPEQWQWSSYRQTAGFRDSCPCLTVDWVLSQFAKTKKTAQEKYREFVCDGISSEPPWNKLVGQVLLGNEEFISTMKARIGNKDDIQEIPKEQRHSARPSLDAILMATTNTKITAEAAYEAHVSYGYKLKEIAKAVGVHYSTVSRWVKTVEERR